MKQLLLLAVLAVSSTGCFHMRADLPGVLDLRSDGSEAAVDNTALPADAARDGIGGFFSGGGVQGTKGDVTIENRVTFLTLGGAFFIYPLNDNTNDEWRTVLGKEGAARNVTIGEGITGGTALNAFLRGLCCYPVFVFSAIGVDLSGSATRIEGSGGSTASSTSSTREESIPPPVGADGAAPKAGGTPY